MAEKKEVTVREKERAGMPLERYPAFVRPFEEMERWFENFFPRGWLSPLRAEWPAAGRGSAFFAHRMPTVDMIDREDEVIVRAEVPGVRKEDLKVSLSDTEITIEGHTEHKEEEKRADYYCHEMSYGDFKRTFELPAEVDASKAQATMKDGLLEIQVPKVERAKRRQVSVEIH